MNDPSAPPELCAYCHLPLDVPARQSKSRRETVPVVDGVEPGPDGTGREPSYCCFGCRFAHAVAAEGGAEGDARWTMTRLGISVFLTMNVMMFTMALWTEDFYDAADLATPAAVSLHGLLRYLCLVLAVPVLLMLGGPLLENAILQTRRGQSSTDLLIVLGVLASFGYSVISVVRDQGHVYFEVGCVVLTAVTLGRWFEAMAKIRATRSLQALARLLPEFVQRLEGGEYRRVSLDDVRADDVLRIGPGERIPVDGKIVGGRALVDQQVVTGESEPVIRSAGDMLLSGVLNLDGDLTLRAKGPPSEGTLQRLATAVREAAESRGETRKVVDRLTRWFVPLTMAIAIATFGAWSYLSGLEKALLSFLAVVLIACPCALGIATPLAIWAALGRASAAQVLIRNGDALPELARCRAFCFDKTGTLTTPSAELVALHVAKPADMSRLWGYADAASGATRHVLAQSLRQQTPREWLAKNGRLPVVSARTTPGRGVRAELLGNHPPIYLGNVAFMDEQSLAWPEELQVERVLAEADAHAQLCVGWDGVVRGLFLFREQMRAEASSVLQWFKGRGIPVIVLTGDKESRARQLAEQLGVDVQAALLPADKQREVQRWQQEWGSVAMIGDGVNDAPALARANVSLAMRCGADLARETADICLLGDDLARIPWLVGLSQFTARTIRQNLFWAFAYNVVGIALAACGLLHPALAAMVMVISSVKVVSNSLRISHYQDPEWPAPRVGEELAPVPATSPGGTPTKKVGVAC